MDSGLLSLKWNNHSSTFFHVLETIRRKELYSDVTIACDGKFFSVHKLVLSTCSEYFQEMFERTQCKHPIIVLKDINHKDLESLLNYMYIGEVNVIQTELSSLIKAAECLKVKGLAVPDEPPPHHKRSSKRPIVSDKDDGFSSKRNRRSGSISQQNNQPNSLPVTKDDRGTSDAVASSNLAAEVAEEKEKELRREEQSSNHNFKEYETIQIKTEKEDTHSEPYIENELPPVSKFEYDGSPVDSTQNASLDETADNSSYSSHLQQQPQPSEDSMGHLLPTTSRFHGESSSWGSDGLEEGDKGGGAEGSNYDPNSYLLDNPQASKSQVNEMEENEDLDSQYYDDDDISIVNDAGFVSSIAESESLVIRSRVNDGFLDSQTHVFQCNICLKTFTKKYVLSVHMRTHSGLKPFLCTYCDYKTCISSNLYRHLRTKHNVQLEKFDTF